VISYFIQELIKEEKSKYYSLDEEEVEDEEGEESEGVKESTLENNRALEDFTKLSSQFPLQFVELLSYLSTSTEYSSNFYSNCYNSLIYRISRKNAIVELIDLVSLLLKYCQELVSLQEAYQKLEKEESHTSVASEELLLKGKELMDHYYHLLIQPINHTVIIENQQNDNYHHADQHHRKGELDERYENQLQLYLLSVCESLVRRE
jgi:hypothetical protein